MKRMIILGLFLGVSFCSSPVLGMDLLGEWVNVEREGHHGALSGTQDHETRTPGDHFVKHDDVSWTLKITSQKGNGFHGQWCSPNKCEDLVGVIRKDGSMLMVDEDSTFFATMHGEKMELCVTETGKDLRVAACHMMKKK